MEYKWCLKCGEEKEVNEFYKNKRTGDGLSVYCKCCSKSYKSKNHNENCKRYYDKNKEELKQKVKEHYQENKEYYSNYHKEYYEKNREAIREYQRLYREKRKKERLLSKMEL